ncbi:unnamed protein product, partial [Linum tenue]
MVTPKKGMRPRRTPGGTVATDGDSAGDLRGSSNITKFDRFSKFVLSVGCLL